MPTLQELLEGDLGVSAQEKTASAAAPQAETDEIEKLAMEAGLLDSVPQAEEQSQGQEKEAQMGLDSLYDNMFPEDAGLVGTQEKTAELEKSAYEQKLGSRAFDHFADRWDARVEKLAGSMSGDAQVSAPEAKPAAGSAHGDGQAAARQPNNRPSDAGQAIDTAPKVMDVVSPQSGAEVVGDEKSQQMKAAALRKHWLLSQLELE